MEAISIGILEKFFKRRFMALIRVLRRCKDVESWMRSLRHDRHAFRVMEVSFYVWNLLLRFVAIDF